MLFSRRFVKFIEFSTKDLFAKKQKTFISEFSTSPDKRRSSNSL